MCKSLVIYTISTVSIPGLRNRGGDRCTIWINNAGASAVLELKNGVTSGLFDSILASVTFTMTIVAGAFLDLIIKPWAELLG